MDVFGNFDEGSGGDDWTAAGATTTTQNNENRDAGADLLSGQQPGAGAANDMNAFAMPNGDAGVNNNMFESLNMNGNSGENNTNANGGDLFGAAAANPESVSNAFPVSQFTNSTSPAAVMA